MGSLFYFPLTRPPDITGYALDGLDGGNQAVSKKTIELNGGETGTWYLDVRAADEPYNITVDAKSHLALWARTTNNSAGIHLSSYFVNLLVKVTPFKVETCRFNP